MVNRYDADVDGDMISVPDGEYVSFADYAYLAKKYRALYAEIYRLADIASDAKEQATVTNFDCEEEAAW